MVDDKTLKERLKRELNGNKLSEQQKDELVSELNFLSNLLIDHYLDKQKQYGEV